jgi:hypothetical protein
MKSHVAIDGVAALVKQFGFTARGTAFYRSTARDEIIHIVYVQSGRGPYEGEFTISMGVFAPSVFRLTQVKEPPRFPNISDCQIETRISTFAGAGDLWWASDDPRTLVDLEPAIRTDLPRFFEAWGSPSAIVERWAEGLPKRSVVMVSPAAVAVFLHEQHRNEEAAEVLRTEYLWFCEKRTPPRWITDVALKLGLDLRV